jgi:HlyD family secretion protein
MALLRQFEPGAASQYRQDAATRGNIVASVTATGTLEPVNKVELGPEISGQITKVLVDYNDHVKTGQVLAVMDTEILSAKVLQSRAVLASAKAKVADATATAREALARLERTRLLVKEGNASTQTLDSDEAAEARARAAINVATAQVTVAEATLSSDETSLQKAEIKSPIDGIVLSRAVEPGQVVAATLETPVLFKLAQDLTKMQLNVNVDEADIGHVQQKQPATFTVDAYPGRQFSATITQVRFAPKTIDNVVTYQAVLSVDNSDLLLRPGMTATAVVTTSSHANALLVPNASLRYQPRHQDAGSGPLGIGAPRGFGDAPSDPRTSTVQRVWVLRRTPQPVAVKVGISDGRYTEILGGDLKAGQMVIVDEAKPAP